MCWRQRSKRTFVDPPGGRTPIRSCAATAEGKWSRAHHGKWTLVRTIRRPTLTVETWKFGQHFWVKEVSGWPNE
jgi:hypothetical protein